MSFASDFEGLPPAGQIQWNQDRTAGMVNYSDPRQQFVYFYRRSVEDPIASRNAGRRIFKGMDYVKIQPPGERLTVIDRPVTEADKQRWTQQWYQYANNHQQIPDGTPVDLLWPDHPEVGDTLRACGVHTIEQCAKLSAHALESIGMGAQEYQNRAVRYLDQAQKGVSVQQFEHRFSELEQKLRLTQGELEVFKQDNARLRGMLEGAQMGVMHPGGYQPAMHAPVQVQVPVPGMTVPSSGTLTPGAVEARAVDLQTQQINSFHPSREEGQQKQKRVVSEATRQKLRDAWERRKGAPQE